MNLNLDPEKLQEQIVEAAVERLLRGDEYFEAEIERRVSKQIATALDEIVAQKFDLVVLPMLTERVDSLVLQKTNEWGEKRGEAVTFVEYLTQRALEYMTENVDRDGKPTRDRYGTVQTRIAHMVDRHLHFHIEDTMKKALGEANTKIAQGIYETCRIKLNEILSTLKVNVSSK